MSDLVGLWFLAEFFPPVVFCTAFSLLVNTNVTAESTHGVNEKRQFPMNVIPCFGHLSLEARVRELGWGFLESGRVLRWRGAAAAKERFFPPWPIVLRNPEGENFLCSEVAVV